MIDYRCQLVVLVMLLTLGLSSVGDASAQSREISGTVRDADSGESLPYASVWIEEAEVGAATNLDGHFVLIDVPADSITLRVSYIGYDDLLFGVPANAGGSAGASVRELEILLSVAVGQFDEVTVTAESYSIMKNAGTVSQVTVSPRDLQVLPSFGDVDIFRSLQLLPGISGTNEAASGLYVRGGTPDQNLVVFDGMTMYHVDHFFGFFSAFNADAIKDVQVYKGGYPAQFGGRTSSVVELTGKSGNANQAHVGLGVNLLNMSGVAEVPIGSKGSFLISARRSYTDVLESFVYTSIYETLTGDDITPEATDASVPGAGRGTGFRAPRGQGGALGLGFGPQGQAIVQPSFYFYDLNAKGTYRPSKNDVVAISFYNGADNVNKSRILDREIQGDGQLNALITNDIVDETNWG